MFPLFSKKENLLKKEGISRDLLKSDHIVLDISRINISLEELKERFEYFELIVYSYNDNKLLSRYKEAHNGAPNIGRSKEIQRINNINFEHLMDINKKSFKRLLILSEDKKEELGHFMDDFCSSIIDADINDTLKFFPKNEKPTLSNKRIDFKSESLISLNLKINGSVTKSLLDIVIKTNKKSSFFYTKIKYSKKGISTSLFLKNTDIGDLDDDLYKIKANAISFRCILTEDTSYKSLLSGLATLNKKELFKDDLNVLRIPKYLKKDYTRMNIVLEDKIDRVVPFDLFKEDNINFAIADYGRSGKTFFLQNLFFNYLLDDTKVRIIDHYGEFSSFVKLFGGTEYKLSEYNSFKLFNKEEELSNEELSKVSNIIFSISTDDLIMDIQKEIKDAIRSSFLIYGSESSLLNIIKFLKNINSPQVNKLIRDLHPFSSKKGEFYFLFNGTEFFDFSNDLISFNLNLLDERVIEAVNIYIFSKFKESKRKRIVFTNNLHNRKKEFFIDYFNKNITVNSNTAYGFDGLDFLSIKDLNTFIYGSTISSKKNLFSEETINLLSILRKDIPNFSEFLLIQGKEKRVIKLKVNSSLRILFSTHPDDIDHISLLSKGLCKNIADVKFKEAFLSASK